MLALSKTVGTCVLTQTTFNSYARFSNRWNSR